MGPLVASLKAHSVRVAGLAGRRLALLHDEPLIPAPLPGEGEGWQDRMVSTTEAGKWLRSMLSKRLGEIEYTTIHTLKGTPLSWCAKGGLSPNSRLLGHHVTGKGSADVYAQIRKGGSLRPDATRSGKVGPQTAAVPKNAYVFVPDPLVFFLVREQR